MRVIGVAELNVLPQHWQNKLRHEAILHYQHAHHLSTLLCNI